MVQQPNDPARAGDLLAQRRIAAEERAAGVAEVLAHLGGLRDSAGGDDEHDPEGVPLSEEWARLVAQRDAAEHEVREIAAAQARLAEGRYGICIDCGREIPHGRLDVLPFALRCVPCAEKAGSR
ncbi:TraR/DksA family transcriptional regulator [Microbacterium nymphoidis]|uniref:TraR/DksA family transcriptional regulator n=1 Tax=Microbacterium nymphoidis TaxID=2898586 RepID=UPI001E3EE53D|nr:TraR/DksA C4-type zinc finger protein [Microbacterium nymphoidis]MCD2497267.1 TraR/DksA family transcriptional regulator [Microbacterium nymphoidis]